MSGLDRADGRRLAFATGLALMLLAVGCGDSSDSEPDAEADVGEAARGSSANLTVGDRTYRFDRVLCAFGPEETGQDDTEFTLSARQDGLQLDATINTRFGHVVSLDDIEDHENPRVAWSAGESTAATAPSEEIIHVDGKRVTAEATFTDQTTGTTADGTLEATCP